VLSGPVSLGR